MILRAKTGVSFTKAFFLSLDEHSVYHSNENQILSTYFCLKTVLYKFYSKQSMYKICPGRNVKKKILQIHSGLTFLYIVDKTDHKILQTRILHAIKCCQGNCKPQNLILH